MTGGPNVYFIDDSATMREVIKIAFRRENINVLACHDGSTALAQMEQVRPDVVISDLIMPDKDGYEVCEYIKHHPKLARTPVILMSGVVNRAVAERAFAVKADELIRKPFQPQDLIARVKHLLNPRAVAPPAPPAAAINANAALSSIFSTSVSAMATRSVAAVASVRTSAAVPAMTAGARAPIGTASAPIARSTSSSPRVPSTPSITAPIAAPPAVSPSAPARPSPAPATKPLGAADLQKLKIEILRMQGLVRKLQSELEAEREYSRALEAHVKTLQESE